MMTDNQLLADYAAEGSDEAFQDLVRRHIDLVYLTAVRMVRGDTQLAEDVAQIVFLDLARKARGFPPGVRLGGWLHRHTCFVAAKVIRSEHRRRSREKEAVAMNSPDDDSESQMARITPMLDDAINQLRPTDRAAIIMRYFERRDLRSVGEALGATENAAQKRVVRAVEELRAILKRRGVACSVTALGVALTGETANAAPAGLAAGIAKAVLLSAPAKTGISLAIIKLMTASNLKTALLGAVVLASLVTPLVVQQRANARVRHPQPEMRPASAPLAAAEIKNSPVSREPVRAILADSLPSDQFHELLRLRGKIGELRRTAEALRRAKAFRDGDDQLPAGRVWSARENRLKQWLEEHPSQKIPEISRLSDKTWINSIYPNALETDDDCRRAMTVIRDNAESPTCNNLADALRRFAADQKGQWPADVSQLRPYLSEPLDDSILNRYAIVPAGSLVADLQTGGDWVLTEKAPIDEYDDRVAIGLTNSAMANLLVTNRWSAMR